MKFFLKIFQSYIWKKCSVGQISPRQRKEEVIVLLAVWFNCFSLPWETQDDVCEPPVNPRFELRSLKRTNKTVCLHGGPRQLSFHFYDASLVGGLVVWLAGRKVVSHVANFLRTYHLHKHTHFCMVVVKKKNSRKLAIGNGSILFRRPRAESDCEEL